MSGSITKFQIIGLYGRRTYDIEINDNTLVLVGENGMGKTTILKFLFGTLTGALRYIPQYRFDRIIITIDNNEYELLYDEIAKGNKVPMSIIKDLPTPIRNELMDLQNGNDDAIELDEIIRVCDMFGYPFERLNHDIKVPVDNTVLSTINQIKKNLNSQILYLPTYRRIEEDLSMILRGKWSAQKSINSRRTMVKKLDNPDYIELVEFGMQDVKEKIEMKQDELSRFSEMSFKNLTYMNLGDVIDRKYQTDIEKLSNVTIEDINKFKLCSSRISKTVLSSQQINKIIDTVLNILPPESYDPHSQIVLYYFRKLLELQSELEEKEQSIRDFCNVCNDYLVNNMIEYDDSSFSVSVIRRNSNPKDTIDMSFLSSGEKQIVSLFSHLYLSKQKKFFVLIDEPELSLSVPWQKTFLEDIRNSNLCSGLIAVTHSPFIYDNSLMQFAHGLGEFITEQ
ncbi:AAA family ATPase [Desulfosporosinus hippei]|uniref:AAA ATPase domain-containing protein n=1 Tax=Desulfosporosinus hippei DSM 8344 TaxID=1121419 RepID=A0A1G8KTW0_9FIRM|nr:AAA family ATPase [Desulfosporosinus hippei]SDI46799.1 AAA ATPase domain-containing protein [Desulfosporosinus hippei DSM 8344]